MLANRCPDCVVTDGNVHEISCESNKGAVRSNMKNPYTRKILGGPEQEEGAQATDIHQVLSERGKRYGEFSKHANYAQGLKRVMETAPKWADELLDSQREALEMIAHKIGRILNGDTNYKDSWVDIAGYATLVADKLKD